MKEETKNIKIDIVLTDDFEECGQQSVPNEQVEPVVKDHIIWGFMYLALKLSSIVFAGCLILICIFGFPTPLMIVAGISGLIIGFTFPMLLAHTYDLAEREEKALGIKRKSSLYCLGMLDQL